MRRRLLGVISLLLVIGGILGTSFLGGSQTQLDTFFDACVRSGIVLGALWLAFPKLIELSVKVPPWLLGAMLLGGLVVAIRPRYLVIVAPLVAALIGMHFLGWLFRPIPKKSRRKGGPRDRPRYPDGPK
jgi:hypothetical protein